LYYLIRNKSYFKKFRKCFSQKRGEVYKLLITYLNLVKSQIIASKIHPEGRQTKNCINNLLRYNFGKYGSIMKGVLPKLAR